MKATFNPMVWVALAALAGPEAAMSAASGLQTPGAATPADIRATPASVLAPVQAHPPHKGDREKALSAAYSADASQRMKLTQLFDASFNDRRRRMENCLAHDNVGPPRWYRRATVAQWWDNQSAFAPPDGSLSDFNTRAVQNQSFATYLHCLQNPPH